MDMFNQIIEQCHHRQHQTLNQRKTVVLPARYDGYPYHFRVHYAHEKSVLLYDLEKADISFLPIGREPSDRAPADWNRIDKYLDRVNNQQKTENWRPRRWFASWGIGIYTGEMSGREGANWHDIEFTYQAILGVPDAVSACLEALINSVKNPLLTLTKTGGLRFSCRVMDYVHPNTVEAKAYIYRHQPTQTDPTHRDVFVKVKGAMDCSVWDARYEILMGSLLEPPVISGDVLFALLGFFRNALHRPGMARVDKTLSAYEPQAFEDKETIKPLQVDERTVSVPEKMRAVREGHLSPLAIKRPTPVLTKQAHSAPEPFEIADILETDARVIAIQTGLRHPDENREIERVLLEKEPLFLSMPTIDYCKEADQYWTAEGFSIGAFWQPTHLAYVVKDVPLDELLKDPFGRGNLCIDSKRYNELFLKGGQPIEIICPKCPVYEECQDQGYHSQFKRIPKTDVIIHQYSEFGTRQLLLDPRWTHAADVFLKDRARVCVVSDVYASDLFVQCSLEIKWLEDWIKHWEGSVLGDFAHAMLNAIRVNENDLTDNIATRVRAVMKAFEAAEETLNTQMCQVNVAGVGADPIGMSMKAAIDSGILDISTVERITEIEQKPFWKPDWTYFHQLKRFFAHYRRDVDAPMWYEDFQLRFWNLPVLYPGVKKLVVLSPSLSEAHLQKVFPNEKVKVYDLRTEETLTGNRVYQLRSEVHSPHSILNYDLDWDALGLSSAGTQFALGAHREVERDSDTRHTLIWLNNMDIILKDTLNNANTKGTYFYKYISRHAKRLRTELDGADVIWMFGAPYFPPSLIWRYAKILYGDSETPLDYSVSMNPYLFKDERLQEIHEQYTLNALMGMLSYSGLKDSGKTIVLKTALQVPGITDAPETLLFDWEDFEIADGLARLSDTIVQREIYEAEYAEMDASWSRERVQFLLGVSTSQANRILQRLRGGQRARVRLEVQLLKLLTDGEKTTVELVDGVQGNPGAVKNALTKLVRQGEIVRVQHGVYGLP